MMGSPTLRSSHSLGSLPSPTLRASHSHGSLPSPGLRASPTLNSCSSTASMFGRQVKSERPSPSNFSFSTFSTSRTPGGAGRRLERYVATADKMYLGEEHLRHAIRPTPGAGACAPQPLDRRAPGTPRPAPPPIADLPRPTARRLAEPLGLRQAGDEAGDGLVRLRLALALRRVQGAHAAEERHARPRGVHHLAVCARVEWGGLVWPRRDSAPRVSYVGAWAWRGRGGGAGTSPHHLDGWVPGHTSQCSHTAAL